jgi:hypothetical protein
VPALAAPPEHRIRFQVGDGPVYHADYAKAPGGGLQLVVGEGKHDPVVGLWHGAVMFSEADLLAALRLIGPANVYNAGWGWTEIWPNYTYSVMNFPKRKDWRVSWIQKP